MSKTKFSDATHLVPCDQISFTANTTLTSAQSDLELNNTGATGEVDLTLPAAVVNLGFTITVTAAQILKLIAAGTDKIYWIGSVPGGATHIFSNQLYSTLDIFCPVAGVWIVRNANFGWTIG